MVKTFKGINIPLNRAEGDLEIKVEVTEGIITDAWSSGTMFRGFEEMMRGRRALDGLVVTPRICGICSLSHLTAAVEALDAIAGVVPPDNARRLRNLALMTETMQSDMRQAVLMFMADFANQEAYKEHPLGEEGYRRYNPLKGTSSIEVIRETKRLVQLVAIIGGQWPHTSFMVPGGVTSIPEVAKILQCRIILERFSQWYERCVLGCTIERWQQIGCRDDLDTWLDESSAHQQGEVGFFIRFARHGGLDFIGKGPDRFLSYGNYPLPVETRAGGYDGKLVKAGFAAGGMVFPFDPEKITEDTSHAWYEQESGPEHPFSGRTRTYASGHGGKSYSWVKAPRYDDDVVETGPLAEMIIGGNPLFQDLLSKNGSHVLARELARLVRPAFFLQSMKVWIDELVERRNDDFYHTVKSIPDGEGAGMMQASRGALGHWVKIQDEKIIHYQIITPSSWNGSPRDIDGHRGAWEDALIGTPIRDMDNPVEAGHVVRSFDPCLVCAVHCVQKGAFKGRLQVDPGR